MRMGRSRALALLLCGCLLAAMLSACAVVKVAGTAVKTTAWAAGTVVKGTAKGVGAVARTVTGRRREAPPQAAAVGRAGFEAQP